MVRSWLLVVEVGLTQSLPLASVSYDLNVSKPPALLGTLNSIQSRLVRPATHRLFRRPLPFPPPLLGVRKKQKTLFMYHSVVLSP